MNIKQTEVAKFMQFSMKTMRSKSRAWKIGLCGHWAELLVTGVSNGLAGGADFGRRRFSFLEETQRRQSWKTLATDYQVTFI